MANLIEHAVHQAAAAVDRPHGDGEGEQYRRGHAGTRNTKLFVFFPVWGSGFSKNETKEQKNKNLISNFLGLKILDLGIVV